MGTDAITWNVQGEKGSSDRCVEDTPEAWGHCIEGVGKDADGGDAGGMAGGSPALGAELEAAL